MKSIPILFLICLLGPFKTFAQKKIAAADLRADLDFLQEALYRGHPGVFRYNSKDSFSLFLSSLRQRIKGDSVPEEQAQVSIRLAVARIRDGHTSVETPFFDDSTRVIPFTFQVLGERVYILGNYSGDSTILRGTEVLQVNDHSAATVVRLGKLIHSGDGLNTSFTEAIAPAFFARHYSLFFGAKPLNKLLVKTPRGDQQEYTVEWIKRADLIQLLTVKNTKTADPKPLLKYKNMSLWRDTLYPDLLVLRMGGFPNKRYNRFYRRMFRLLEKEKTTHLAIDLRYNTGGNVHNMGFLIAQILDQPFQYQYECAKNTHMGKYFRPKAKFIKAAIWMRYNLSLRFGRKKDPHLQIRTWKVRPKKRHNYDGEVYVLTNGWSFSAASMCASFLKNKGNAITIGTETGGSETGNCGGGYPTLRLPHTRYKVRFPMRFLRYDIGKPLNNHGVEPQYPTPYTLQDILDKRDLEMEKLHELVAQKKK